ncbi:hypothetical protein PV377_32725 [Streptomyces ipomoeae]|uniref:hypothetical protein n=1 Tax=Streptomyces ipomoeae TaxID=103232 RepID=UPI00299FEA89|nr:hypothetical protein [Streptomyces ipomoeae]MDX2843652.1 hypothetical protein [Streptomyces ipomoeae]
MSKASEKSRASIGAALRNGLEKRGGGAQLPAQAASGAEVELSPHARLDALEKRIEASLGQYQVSLRQLQLRHKVELGQLLNEINEDELFKLHGYGRFGDYVKGRWGWDRSYGYRLIDLALVRRALAPLGQAVVDTVVEAQARELAPVVKHHGDEAARNFVEVLRVEAAGGAKVTAAVIRERREKEGLGAPSSGQSPIGDEDEVVDAELVDDEDRAEKVGLAIRSAAATAEKALKTLDEALALDVAPFHTAEAAVDLSRIRSAAVRLQHRADGIPGPAGS